MSKNIIIIGAGLAGASCAYQLALANYQVTVLDKAVTIENSGASTITAAHLYPRFDAEINKYSWFYYICYQHTLSFFTKLADNHSNIGIHNLGSLVFIKNAIKEAKLQKFLQVFQIPSKLMHFVDVTTASQIAQIPCPTKALYLPNNLTVSLPQLRQFYLSHPNITLRIQTEVEDIIQKDKYWQVRLVNNDILEAEILVLCNANTSNKFKQTNYIKLRNIRGQSTVFSSPHNLTKLNTVLHFNRSLTPALGGKHHLGSTFEPTNKTTSIDRMFLSATSQDNNINALKQFLPKLQLDLKLKLNGQIGWRCYTKDSLPIIGSVACPERNAYYPRLYISVGHGARGLLSCMIAAEIISCNIQQRTQTFLPESLIKATNSHRFLLSQKFKNQDSQTMMA